MLVLTIALCSRLVAPPPLQQVQVFTAEQSARMQERIDAVLSRFRTAGSSTLPQPAFAGCWRTAKTDNLDGYLEQMGVGSLKRAIAAKASQQQCLCQISSTVVELKMTDKRGTMVYEIKPDNNWHQGTGFMKLPMTQRAKYGRDGALLVEEKYRVHLGGDKHLQKCSPAEAPVILSRRCVEKGQMVVEIKRTLTSGEDVCMKTWYSPIEGKH